MEQAWQNYQEKLTRLDSKHTISLPTKEVHVMCSIHSILIKIMHARGQLQLHCSRSSHHTTSSGTAHAHLPIQL